MNRRQFVASGIGGALAAHSLAARQGGPGTQMPGRDSIRRLFPRLQQETFLNAAAGTPLGRFAEEALAKYQEYWKLGPSHGRGEQISQALSEMGGLFARLIGAQASEIGLVHCTKAGEQIVLDSLPGLREGGNVVTNDLHFSGSLHNLIGLRKAGLDVRIVRNRDWDVSLQSMLEAMDDRTALLSVSLVSNINGRLEPMRQLCKAAHERGALVYADIIQAAGIVPLNLAQLGVDFAACNGYKWLFGPYGAGFFYVRQELQGTALPDRLYPGHVRPNYPPWVENPETDLPEYAWDSKQDATRYQPGHVSYLGYCALYEGLKFIESFGVEQALEHSTHLNRRLKDRLDPDRYRCISPQPDRSPIITFIAQHPSRLQERLSSARIVVSLSGNRIRVSPAVFNNSADIDRLAEVLNQA